MYHKGTWGGGGGGGGGGGEEGENAFIIKYYHFMQHESACESHAQAQYWRICLPLACLLVHHWVDASIQYFIFGKSHWKAQNHVILVSGMLYYY